MHHTLQRLIRNPLGFAARGLRAYGLGGWLPPGAGKMPRSGLASRMLAGLKGIEIGGAASNDFGLDTINVDFIDHRTQDTAYAREQMRVCGEVLPVDVIATGKALPFPDKSYDFVLASHVIEHIYDPIGAIEEWVRVARRYVYLVVPHKERTCDRPRPVTPVDELLQRHRTPPPPNANEDKHWNVWRTADFEELVRRMGLPMAAVQDQDDKIGNGFTVVIGDLMHPRDAAL
jgi:SAM-dependent methyltransferase